MLKSMDIDVGTQCATRLKAHPIKLHEGETIS